MKIGILGAPGAGKSEFAHRLKIKLSESLFPESFYIIDDYVQDLKRETNLALGPWAAHFENYMIAGVRIAEEYRVKKYDTITVGTVLDTLTYSLILGSYNLSLDSTNEEFEVAKAAVNGFGLIYSESWDYNLSFYLPLENPTGGERWPERVDKELRNVISSFHVPAVMQLDGTTDERLDVATRIIEELETKSEEATEAETTPVD